jgi:hypothetical protein
VKTGRGTAPPMKRAVEAMLARGKNCTEGQARDAVAEYLRRKVVPEWLWSRLAPRHEGLWKRPAAAEDLTAELQALYEDASGQLYCHRQRGYRGRRRDVEKEIQLNGLIDPRETKRAQVLAAEFGRLASSPSAVRSGGPTVAEFRERYLGGRLLAGDEAYEFLNSDVLRYVDWSKSEDEEEDEDFDVHIPMLGFTSRVVEDRTQFNKVIARLRHRVMFDISWKTEQHRVGVEYTVGRDDWLALRFPDREKGTGTVRARPGSALGVLQALSVALAKSYLWAESEAVWFVLTGTVPEVPCLTARSEGGWSRDHTHERIVLSIEPWVSAKTVMRVFRKVQVDWLRKENRQPKARSLDLLAFVSPRKAAGMHWRTILKEWNETHPKSDRYGPDGVRNLKRDFEAVYLLVLHPIEWLRDE